MQAQSTADYKMASYLLIFLMVLAQRDRWHTQRNE